MTSDNFFGVYLHQELGVPGEVVSLSRPIRWITKDEALNLAAWLVVLSDDSAQYDKFRALLKRIEESAL